MELSKLKQGTENTYMEIDISHQDESMNYFSGNRSSKGIYVYFGEYIKQGNILSRTMSLIGDRKNFKICLYEYDRKNNKKIELAEKVIENIKDKLFELYEQGKNNELYNTIKEIDIDKVMLYEKLQEKVKVKTSIIKEIVKI